MSKAIRANASWPPQKVNHGLEGERTIFIPAFLSSWHPLEKNEWSGKTNETSETSKLIPTTIVTTCFGLLPNDGTAALIFNDIGNDNIASALLGSFKSHQQR